MTQPSISYKTDTIPMWQLEAAQADGWEVFAYSEYVNGIPKFAEVRKPIRTPIQDHDTL